MKTKAVTPRQHEELANNMDTLLDKIELEFYTPLSVRREGENRFEVVKRAFHEPDQQLAPETRRVRLGNHVRRFLAEHRRIAEATQCGELGEAVIYKNFEQLKGQGKRIPLDWGPSDTVVVPTPDCTCKRIEDKDGVKIIQCAKCSEALFKIKTNLFRLAEGEQ